MADTRAGKVNMIDRTDFLLCFCGEKIPGSGEDSFAYALRENGALLGVFDGCGGSGAGRYPGLQGRTGAYLAGRAASAAWMQWYENLDPEEELRTEDVKDLVLRNLRICEKYGGECGELVGSMAKRLPTTAAVAVCRPRAEETEVLLQWAGDSRVFWLDGEGLAQLTQDDLGGIDPMENLTRDAPLSNAITLSRDFQIHSAKLSLDRPGLLFTATDGCFGYVSTPMEFEYLLLSTLRSAQNAVEWERGLEEAIGKISGDDYTLCGLSLGCGSFAELQRQLQARTLLMERVYINGLDACTREEKQLLWERYKGGYLRILCRT